MRNSEIIGLLASAFTIASFVVKGERRIRIINLLACVCFVTYGILIHAPSVYIANGAIFIIHLVRMEQMKRQKK